MFNFFSEHGPSVSLKRKRNIEDNSRDFVVKFMNGKGCSENFTNKLTVPLKKVKKYTIGQNILIYVLLSKFLYLKDLFILSQHEHELCP